MNISHFDVIKLTVCTDPAKPGWVVRVSQDGRNRYWAGLRKTTESTYTEAQVCHEYLSALAVAQEMLDGAETEVRPDEAS